MPVRLEDRRMDLTKMDRQNLSKKATDTLKEFELLSCPVDIVRLAQDCYGFMILETMLPQKITGMMAVDLKNPVLGTGMSKVIVISSALSAERQRFVVAHELAHYINRKNDEPLYFRDYDNSQNLEELKADYLARCLLMPEELCSKSDSINMQELIRKFTNIFWISEQRARERIDELGLCSR